MYRLMAAESILGPLPFPWRMRYANDEEGIRELRFVNDTTGEDVLEDPRLGPWPRGWVAGENGYINRRTREWIRGDPRMLPEVLEARGVKLTKFRLV
jgi:hypothetical protein